MPKVSVVTSVYNGEAYLEECVESILNQTYVDFEFIIINDGSTDNSLRIIENYSKIDSRIVVIDQENIGLTKSLNKGIFSAKGEIIARQDADDVSLPHRFETQLPWVKERDFDLCCNRTCLNERQRPMPQWSYWIPKGLLILKLNPFVHGTYLMRKDRVQTLGGYDEIFHYTQDYELMTRWLGSGLKVKYLRDCLYQTRQTVNSTSQKKRSKQAFYFRQIRQSWFMHVRKTPRLLLL